MFLLLITKTVNRFLSIHEVLYLHLHIQVFRRFLDVLNLAANFNLLRFSQDSAGFMRDLVYLTIDLSYDVFLLDLDQKVFT